MTFAPIQHREDLIAFVTRTAPAVVRVLVQLFPEIKAVPRDDGVAIPSCEGAGSDYQNHAHRLSSRYGEEGLQSGKVILQWCVAACFVAEASNHSVLQSEDYLPVRFLCEAGGVALARRESFWGGKLEEPVQVSVPWPETIGACVALGPVAAAAALGCDIQVCDDKAWLNFGAHHIAFVGWSFLTDAFDDATSGKESEAMVCTDFCLSNQYSVRGERRINSRGLPNYAFRFAKVALQSHHQRSS